MTLHSRPLRWLPVIGTALLLAVWGNRWGAPDYWHPDEVTASAITMAQRRTLNPGTFFYGALPRFAIIAGAVLPVRAYARVFDPRPAGPDAARAVWTERQTGRIIRMARTVSALFDVALVLATAAVAWLLLGEAVAWLAALLLALAPGAVVLAHFATVDIGATAWFWAACAVAVAYWRRPQMTWWFFWACLLGGLAFGTKADRALVVFPLVTAWALAPGRSRRALALGLLVGFPIGYLAANPMLLLAPFEYLDGFTRDLFYNALRGSGRSSYAFMLQTAVRGLGPLLAALVVVAGSFGVARLWTTHRRGALLWLLSTFVPFFVIVGHREVLEWYVPFLFPGVLILTALGGVELVRSASGRSSAAVAAAIAAVAAATLAQTTARLRFFTADPRYRAMQWIDAHLPPGSRVEVVGLITVPHDRLDVITAPDLRACPFHMRPLRRLERHATYRVVRAAILESERSAAPALGLRPRREPYRAWFDHMAVKCAGVRPAAAPDDSGPPPDFVVRVGKAVGFNEASLADYVVVKEFEPTESAGTPPSNFLGRPVTVLARRTEPTCSTGSLARRTGP
jgi:hypothetical protein